jgi:hypothetical protein
MLQFQMKFTILFNLFYVYKYKNASAIQLRILRSTLAGDATFKIVEQRKGVTARMIATPAPNLVFRRNINNTKAFKMF